MQDENSTRHKQINLSKHRPDAPGRVGIGLDFGTSNSAAAIFDGSRIHLIPLERRSWVMPSATYIDRDYRMTTGQDAIDRYIESNTGRTVELSAEVLGEGRTTTGQTGDSGLPEEAETRKIYGRSLVDGSLQGRLFLGIKRLLGSTEYQRVIVFERPFRLVALITPLLLRMHNSIRQKLTALAIDLESNRACIGHPVNFEGTGADRNRLALGALSEAAGHAEFHRRVFYAEPIAASLSYLHDTADENPLVLTVDFGGGTLDLCVLRRRDEHFDVLATHGIGLGGDHIDQLLFRELLFPLLGRGERWRRAGEDREIETLFPFEEYEDLLLNWPVSYMLNQNKYTGPLMNRIQAGDEAATRFRRLYDLIKYNYSYLVFQCIKDVKASLSMQESAVLDIPELDIELILTRGEFEELINPLLEQFARAIAELLQKAGLDPGEVGLVLRTGGSSLIPAVKRLLEAGFPGRVVEHDPFTSVAAGLAIAEYFGLGDSADIALIDTGRKMNHDALSVKSQPWT